MYVTGRNKTSRAFALPTVLIASIVLLSVLAVSVTATAAVRTTLKNQYYVQLAQTAGEAGVAMAKACLAASGNIPQWTDAKPLTPATDCAGNVVTVPSSSAFVVSNGNVRSAFSVPRPSLDPVSGQAVTIANNGYVEVTRSTPPNAVWRTYRQPSVQAAVVPDLCSGNATAARGWSTAVRASAQKAFAPASSAQTITLAAGNLNAGTMYFRKDFTVSTTGTYDLNVYTSSSQDSAKTYLDGKYMSVAAGSLATTTVDLTAGCHTLVTQLTNQTYLPRASDFVASITRGGAATPIVVTDSSWRVSAGDATHFSTNNYTETPSAWEQALTLGIWNNAALPWAGVPTNWATVSGDSLTDWVTTRFSSGGTNRPGNSYAWLRDTKPFTVASETSVRVSNFCDDSCDLYLDGALIMSSTSAGGVNFKTIIIQPGTHTFGVRLYNTAAGSSGFLFAAVNITPGPGNGTVLARSSPNWNSTTSWSTTAGDPYSFDAAYVPVPAVQAAANAQVLVVGGGGGGGSGMGGGGGGGAVVYNAASPITNGTYTVVVGAGGAGGPTGSGQVRGVNGENSFFGAVRALGGGGGGSSYSSNNAPPGSGSSAGGSAGGTQTLQASGVIGLGSNSVATLGNFYPTGGGGAGGPGAVGPATGGVGISNAILGTSYFFGGGGGGSGYTTIGGNGGNGGGGGGAVGVTTGGSGLNPGSAGGGGTTVAQTNRPGGNAGANTGGGGGGGSHFNSNNFGGNGGSGIVVISYPIGSMTASGGTETTVSGFTIRTFTSSGTFTVSSIN